MNFLNKVKNLFFGGEASDDDDARRQRRQGGEGAGPSNAAPKRPRSGASPSKPVATAVESEQREPVLRDVKAPEKGGIQGLNWYAASQVRDQHGDFANGFFDEHSGTNSRTAEAALAENGEERVGAHGLLRGPAVGGGRAAGGQAARQPSRLKVKDVHKGAVVLEHV
ncbi:hypothetical protein PLESTB_001792600 [Pleodorina starrii]|uniref:Uncharacterized protein n=1 Tax=Pleodorina starrii TaxID=330485 RepID=A0A9W6BZX7_9CHLO|nr:hypothetical protein PLESTM_001156800 [Pleodorina starrii]GLC61691.1 hypothetical protein PLESTB_001792600 [Pleodorina starrii]GLC69170.1 hypothetical protein PLESTF_000798100 [Pleodorina starrii]